MIGEGAGVLILESLDHALARGAGDSACDIYGEVVGYGMSGDAEHITAGREDGEGALSAMKMAFRFRNIYIFLCVSISSSKTINQWISFLFHFCGNYSLLFLISSQVGESAVSDLWCINAHATSTPRGDAAESVAIEKLLGCSTKTADFKPFLSSNKGAIGHLLGAAGSVESIFALLSLQSGILSPSANLDKLGFDIKSDSVEMLRSDAEGEKDRSVSGKDLVLKNSFGFGGTNVSLLFKKFVI